MTLKRMAIRKSLLKKRFIEKKKRNMFSINFTEEALTPGYKLLLAVVVITLTFQVR